MLNNWLVSIAALFVKNYNWILIDWVGKRQTVQFIIKWLVILNEFEKNIDNLCQVLSVIKNCFYFYYFYEPEHKEYIYFGR